MTNYTTTFTTNSVPKLGPSLNDLGYICTPDGSYLKVPDTICQGVEILKYNKFFFFSYYKLVAVFGNWNNTGTRMRDGTRYWNRDEAALACSKLLVDILNVQQNQKTMSNNLIQDIRDMHNHYGVHEAVADNASDPSWLAKLLEFRSNFLQEELDELKSANDPEDVTDALIDLVVVALGTLDLFQADSQGAWDEVLRANMEKEVGIKPSRPNPLGLPDLIKPEGWSGPVYTKESNGLFEQLELPLK